MLAGLFAGVGGTGDFIETQVLTDSLYLDDLVVGDIDGDGDIDAIAEQRNSASATLLLNNGSGTFTAAGSYAFNTGSIRAGTNYTLELGDIDGDDDLDVVASGRYGVRVWKMDRRGFIDTGQDLGNQSNKVISLGDLDGDGDLDLIMGRTDEDPGIYLNDGTGTFSKAVDTSYDPMAFTFAEIVDVDGDNDNDIVVGNYAEGQVWRNDNGVFTLQGTMSWYDARVQSVAVGDINNDGSPDLVFSTNYEGTPWINDGTGLFSPSSEELLIEGSDLELQDFDGDGDLDILTNAALLLNNGTGVFAESPYALPHVVDDIAAGDFDGDGDIDVWVDALSYNDGGYKPAVWLNSDTTVEVYIEGTPDSEWVIPGEQVSYQLVVENTSNWDVDDVELVGLFTGPTSGLVLQSVTTVVGGNSTLADGDLGESWNSTLTIPANSSVVLELTTQVLAGEDPALTLGDLVSLQVEVHSVGGQTIGSSAKHLASDERSVLLDSPILGDHLVESTTTLKMGITRDVALGDLDGDGDLDAFLTASTENNQVWWNDGTGVFTDSGQRLSSPAHESYGDGGCGAVALGDIDGDGDLDAVVSAGYSTRLWLNDGTGNFTLSSVSFKAPTDTYDGGGEVVLLEDFDGNGTLDIALLDYSRQSRVWFNAGSGVFDTYHDINIGRHTSAEAADVDGDGDIDIVSEGLLLINDGTGEFSGGYTSYEQIIALGDLNGDGVVDLLNSTSSGRTYIYLGNGEAAFVNSGNYYYSTGSLRDVQVGDFDNDGDLDFFQIFDEGDNRLWLNNGDATFVDSGLRYRSTAGERGAVGDIDGDGDLDLVIATSSGFDQVLVNASLPELVDLTVTQSDLPVQMQKGEYFTFTVTVTNATRSSLSGVEFTESFTATLQNAQLVSVTTAGGAVSTATPGSVGLTLVDSLTLPAVSSVTYEFMAQVAPALMPNESTDQTGVVASNLELPSGYFDSDLDSNSTASSFLVVEAPTGGSATFSNTFSVSNTGVLEVTDVALGDLNGDGYLDAILARNYYSNLVWYGNGDGTFQRNSQVIANTGYTLSVNLGDVDNDGDLDVVFGKSNGETQLWWNDGTGYLVNSGVLIQSSPNNVNFVNPDDTALADMDGDGDLDLVFGGNPAATMVFFNDGAGSFTPSDQIISSVDGPLEIGDLDKDGDIDLIVGNYVLFNDGNGLLTAVRGDFSARQSAIRDFDGDGDLDMVVYGSDGIRLWINNGQGEFKDSEQDFEANSPRDLAAADFDGDGDFDIVVAATTQYGDRNRVWINDGTGNFTLSTVEYGDDNTVLVFAGDLNNDGAIDYFEINSGYQESHRVWLNASADLSVKIEESPASEVIQEGEIVRYTITAENAGQVDVAGATVEWQLAGMTDINLLSIQIIGDAESSLAIGSLDAQVLDTVNLPVGAKIVYEVEATVGGPLLANGAVESTAGMVALIATPSGLLDGNTANDVATELNVVELASTGGIGLLQVSSQVFESTRSRSVAMGDLDGDGDLDVYVGMYYGLPSIVLLNNGDGTFVEGGTVSSNGENAVVLLGDLDGDGDLDIFDGRLLLNDGAGNFTLDTRTIPDANYDYGALPGSLADIDGDGDLDVIPGYDNTHILLNDGTGGFKLGERTGSGYGGAGDVGDIDGDGDLDLVYSTVICFNRGDGVFEIVPSNYSTHYGKTVLADVDNDGDLDYFLLADITTKLLLNDGLGQFTDSGQRLGSLEADDAKAADFNCDGYVDLLLDGKQLWLNDGTGVFVNSGQELRQTNTRALAVGDLDGDGDVDAFVVGGAYVTTGLPDEVWFNLSGDLFTDIQVENQSPVASVVQGETTSYTLTITNNGPSAVNSVALVDQFSSNLHNIELVSFEATAGATSDSILGLIEGNEFGALLNLPVGSSITYHFQAVVAASGTANESSEAIVWSTASVSLPEDLKELLPIDNVSSDNDLVDLSTTLGNGAFVQWGETLGLVEAVGDIALGDLDGDGDLDLFVGNLDRQPDTVWLNDGLGNFTNTNQQLGSSDTQGVTLADMDGDGDLDALADGYLWRNDGSGVFEAWGVDVASLGTRLLVAADLNGDGIADVINRGYVYLNDGEGNLTLTDQQVPTNVWLGDVDGDGDLDAVGRGNTNELWLNDGYGNFTYTFSFGSDGNGSIGAPALVDLDGDGDLDAFFSGVTSPVWFNDGNGGFTHADQELTTSTTHDVKFADIDNDGDLDALFATGGGQANVIYLNDGTGNFSLSEENLGYSYAYSVVTGDLDGDGDIDAVVANYSGQGFSIWMNLDSPVPYDLSVESTSDRTSVSPGETVTYTVTVRNDGPQDVVSVPISDTYAGTIESAEIVQIDLEQGATTSLMPGLFTGGFDDVIDLPIGASITYYVQLTASDRLSANGQPEEIISNGLVVPTRLGLYTDLNPIDNNTVDADVRVFTSTTGTATYVVGEQVLAVDPYSKIETADLNGDGELDLIAVNGVTPTRVWLGSGGTFVQTAQLLQTTRADGGVLGDLDGDGDLDLLITLISNASGETSAVWLNDGTGHFSPLEADSSGMHGNRFALGDMDGDGDLDAVSPKGVWANDGQGYFSRLPIPVPTNSSNRLVLGDLDNDGDLDAVISDNATRVWLNDGSGQFTAVLTGSSTSGENASLGDIDHDGDLDILVGTSILLNNGSGLFGITGSLIVDGVSQRNIIHSQLADLDGDQDLDALLVDSYGTRIWLNNGSGVFEASQQVLDTDSAYFAAVGDWDSDGDVDFLVTANDGSTHLWRNLETSEVADVSIQKIAAGEVYRDDVLVYEVTIKNTGSGDAQAVFTDTYDPLLTNLQIVSITTTGGATHSLQSAAIDHHYTASVTLPAGATLVFQVVADTPASLGENLAAEMRFTSSASIETEGVLVDTDPTNQQSVMMTIGQLPSVESTGLLMNTGQQFGSGYVGGVAVGDLDGDGDLDAFVVARGEADQVLLNDGQGTFTPSEQQFDAETTSTDVALADFDGDGDLDAFITTRNHGQQLWLNDGSGFFINSQQPLGTTYGTEVVAVDIEGDGDLDALVNVWSGDGWRVWLNDGTGDLSTESYEVTESRWPGANIGELNGDGVPDVFGSAFCGCRYVFLGEEPGVTLEDYYFLEDEADNQDLGLKPVLFGDVNSDGYLDVFVVTQDINRWWINDGTGHFTPGTAYNSPDGFAAALGDIDGDGIIDAIVAGRGEVSQTYMGSGASQTLAIGDAWDVALGDFDGDGDLDAIVVATDGAQIWLNADPTDLQVETTAASSSTVGELATYVLTVSNQGPEDSYQAVVSTNLASVVNDLMLVEYETLGGAEMTKSFELVAGEYRAIVDLPAGSSLTYIFTGTPAALEMLANASDASLTWHASVEPSEPILESYAENNTDSVVQLLGAEATGGGASFVSTAIDLESGIATDVKVGDINSDGYLDAVVSYRSGGTKVYLQNPDGTFTESSQVVNDEYDSFAVSLGDLDSDGKLEIVVGNRSNAILVVQVNSNGVLTTQSYFQDDETITRDLLTGDVDGDGQAEIIEINIGEPSRVLADVGYGAAALVATLDLPATVTRAALGDFDGDGILDLYLGLGEGEADQIWLGDGQGNFVDSGQRLSNYSTTDVAIGDIDGDGTLDVIAGSEASPVTLYLNDGTGQLVATWHTATPGNTGAVALADFDGDGDLDAVLASSNNDPSRVLLNEEGVFASYLQIDGGYQSTGVATGDINGDGTIDILFAGVDQTAGQLWLNQDALSLGDYNRDGVTDVEDYGLWKQNVGSSGVGLTADGNGDGIVDLADYVLWRNHLNTQSAEQLPTNGVAPRTPAGGGRGETETESAEMSSLVGTSVEETSAVQSGATASGDIPRSPTTVPSRRAFTSTAAKAETSTADSQASDQAELNSLAIDAAFARVYGGGHYEAPTRAGDSSSADDSIFEESLELELVSLASRSKGWKSWSN